ncbi:uncharacterized protein YndB with AHSA1/START domain [Marinoscillum furvescens DSM 4134]|uniref:Uncharacterized protein YndB with AHSA1/START domain n=2 Tax=Marinoscillum furvescens TaxID=1026 RepID=A0A3D9KW97_MARFU|nr:uncharacterized protein YndB with AHSA1/START domain [Marinoscillum furvescens DSM 4134]
MKQSDPPIVVEKPLAATRVSVWQALTQLDQMHQWYFENLPDFKPEPGFKVRFPVRSETRTFTHRWTVMEVMEFKHIKVRWQYDEYPGDSTVTFSLVERNEHTHITVTCEILADFPEAIPEFERESCIGGWEYFLGRLQNYLSSI